MGAPKTAKILVIDDDLDILTAIEAGLQLPGIKLEITTAHNALVGLQQAKLWIPDLIVLDLNLPDMDGFELMREIKRDGQLNKTKIIMLTAQDSSQNLWQGLDSGIDDFISKPFDLFELEARVYNQLSAGKSAKG